jgi:GDPmannose 4,6-dehydratase
MNKVAIVTGATGQDGSYLIDLLISKGDEYSKICCLVRRTTYALEHSNITETSMNHPNVHFFTADLLDQTSLTKAFETCADADRIEVYNLAAQSHVGVSFNCPRATSEVNFIGVLNLLETIRQLGLVPKCRFYQASTSEMFGKVQEIPQTELTPFYPRSPYGVSKMAAHWIVRNYRESYGLFACCGILFNHESPRRGIEFVTQKIAKGARDVMIGKTDVIRLGNLDSKRDWGHAEDYVEAMWLMMQHDTDGEYVVSTGKQRSVREFVELVFANYGVRIGWVGSGTDEVGVDIKTDRVLIKVDPAFYRPCEVETLVGDPEKIRSIGWEPKHTFGDLVRSMVGNDANTVRKLYA